MKFVFCLLRFSLLSCAKCTEVLTCLWYNICEKLKNKPSNWLFSNGNIHIYKVMICGVKVALVCLFCKGVIQGQWAEVLIVVFPLSPAEKIFWSTNQLTIDKGNCLILKHPHFPSKFLALCLNEEVPFKLKHAFDLWCRI